MKRFLLLHGYSAANRGDALLVDESLTLIKEAVPASVIDLAASDPVSFASGPFRRVFRTKPLSFRLVRNVLAGKYDGIVAVGGGYQRYGTVEESFKTAIVHLPQLLLSAFARLPVVYLSQSVGPLRGGSRPVIRKLISRLDLVSLRDDRSMSELGLTNARRVPDLALLTKNGRSRGSGFSSDVPIIGTRDLGEKGRDNVTQLAKLLREFDGFIQSSVGSNSDAAAVSALRPRNTLSSLEMTELSTPRIVVSVRLHGALMALNAGHYVIHLSYERKGFGAFQDLGLEDFVFNVNEFSPGEVLMLIRTLQKSADVRQQYDCAVETARVRMSARRGEMVEEMQRVLAG